MDDGNSTGTIPDRSFDKYGRNASLCVSAG